MRAWVGALTVLMLVAAACGSGGSEDSEAGPEVPEAGENPAGEGGEAPEPPEGAVAVVDGNQISEEDFEAQLGQVLAIPAVAEQLEGGQDEAAEPIFRAQVLSQLVVSDILFRAAEDDFGIEVTDEDVEGRLDELHEEAGGEDEFGRQLEEDGLTEEVLVAQELPLVLTIEEVQDEVAGDAAEEPPPPPSPDQQQPPSEAELALQDWVLGKFADAEVSVRSEIGTWDPQTGQVQPPGGASGIGPGGQPQPG